MTVRMAHTSLRGGEYVLALARDYFLGVAMGEVAAPAAPSSIPKVQCASTFFPWDFALIITLHDFSCSFCVTWYDTVRISDRNSQEQHRDR